MAKKITTEVLREAWEYHPVYGTYSRRCYKMQYADGQMDHCVESWREYMKRV